MSSQTIDGVLVPHELIKNAIEALTRHLSQHAPMQVPPSKADSDLVREELRALLDASAPSDWERGLEDAEGNELVTVRADEYARLKASQPQPAPVAWLGSGVPFARQQDAIEYASYKDKQVKPLYTEQPAPVAECCSITPEDKALLDAGDYTPEELFGVGGKPSCLKCHKA